MAPLVRRHLESELQDSLKYSRIVNVVGPRQVGKTTLVRDLFHRGQFITLDRAQTLQAFETDAYDQISILLERTTELPIIIDEAPLCKNLPKALKLTVDKDNISGQFLLTGSSNVFRTKHVIDSLAGRVETISLPPLSAGEIHDRPASRFIEWALQDKPSLADISADKFTRDYVIDLILRGGFPSIRNNPIKRRQRQYFRYLQMMIERDVADILNIRKPDAFRQLINQMAARTGNEISIQSISKSIGINRETTEQYLNILERLSVIIKLGAWASSESKREIRNSKSHFVDSGILSALRKFSDRSFDPDNNPSAFGAVLESYIVNEILRSLPYQDTNLSAYHWRSADKREIDMIVERDRSLVGIEVKAASGFSADDLHNLLWFSEVGPGKNRKFTGVLFYLGNDVMSLGNNIFAIPVSTLWS